jgi:hypothetical protein
MNNIQAWRLYLNIGNPDDPNPDFEFLSAIKTAEKKLSHLITSDNIILPNNISPEEYDKAMKLVRGQARMDALGPIPTREERPTATKFMVTDEESKLNSWNPETTQQQGITVEQFPKSENEPQAEESNPDIDERMEKLTDLMEEV